MFILLIFTWGREWYEEENDDNHIEGENSHLDDKARGQEELDKHRIPPSTSALIPLIVQEKYTVDISS